MIFRQSTDDNDVPVKMKQWQRWRLWYDVVVVTMRQQW